MIPSFAATEVLYYLGFTSCLGAVPMSADSVFISVSATSPPVSSRISFVLATAAATGGSKPVLSTQDKGGIGVGVSLFVLIAVGFLLFGWRIWQRKRQERVGRHADKNSEAVDESTQPYLQPKAELEDAENRKHELNALNRRFELEGDTNMRLEMPAVSQYLDSSPPLLVQIGQELRGEEHAQEKGSP